jgi:hypothetical protein
MTLSLAKPEPAKDTMIPTITKAMSILFFIAFTSANGFCLEMPTVKPDKGSHLPSMVSEFFGTQESTVVASVFTGRYECFRQVPYT